MEKTATSALLDHFATLPNPRIARHRWHKLSDIVVIAVCVVLCGALITHDALPTVSGDPTRIGQVFQNLIGNALKFCKDTPPRIHVSAGRDGQHWRFAVSDNGIGIDLAQAPRLFQVFQRLHPRSAYPGTGIGLAICKKIVEQHGGCIWVESRLGEGATFYFTIGETTGHPTTPDE